MKFITPAGGRRMGKNVIRLNACACLCVGMGCTDCVCVHACKFKCGSVEKEMQYNFQGERNN